MKVINCSNPKFNPWRDRWQMPLESVIDILMVKTHIKKYTIVVINGNENHMKYIFILTKMSKV